MKNIMGETKMKKTKKNMTRHDVYVALITPYLRDNLSDRGESEEYIKMQIEKYGYNPNNFNGQRFLKTENKLVFFETPDNHIISDPRNADLLFIGCAGDSVGLVNSAKPFGTVVARYSIFYGGKNDYTGELPENEGYSIDMPKDVDTVRCMLSNDNVLEALIARNENQLRTALDKLNSSLDRPILATPYLSHALSVKREPVQNEKIESASLSLALQNLLMRTQ
jgi:hypothetical protein